MKTIALTAALLVAGLGASNARADNLQHLHDLAESLQAQSAATAREIYFHLSAAPDFTHLYSDSLELYRQTERLHALVDAAASPQALDRQIHLMEDTQKHIADLVEAMEEQNKAHRRHHHHFHHYGRVSQFHLERVCDLVTQMGETIDHMHSDVVALLPQTPAVPLPPGVQPAVTPAVVVPAPPGPVFPRSTGRTIDIRRGGVSFSLRLR